MDGVKSGDRWGPYIFDRRIGAGGMAEAWRAVRIGVSAFRRPVCIKVIHPHLCADPTSVQLFDREAQIGSRCEHPNVVHTEAYEAHDGRHGLVLEFVDGINLGTLGRRFAARGERCPAEIASFITHELLLGLDDIHDRRDSATGEALGVVHCDVSPANVLIGFVGSVKLGDFGIARSQMTKPLDEGIVRGKPWYMPLEQYDGRPIDGRADLYALGVTLYELLGGRKPLWAEKRSATAEEVRAAKGRNDYPPLAELRPDLSAAFVALVESLMARDPDARPATASDAYARLRAAVPTCSDGEPLRRLMATLRREAGASRASEIDLAQMRDAVSAESATVDVPSPIAATRKEYRTPTPRSSKARPRATRATNFIFSTFAVLSIAAVGVGASLRMIRRRSAAVQASPRRPVEERAQPRRAALEPVPPAADTPRPANAAPDVASPDAGNTRAPPQVEYGRLSVVVLPWADVYVDDRYRGRSPLMLTLPVGMHRVMVNGGVPRHDERVRITTNRLVMVHVLRDD